MYKIQTICKWTLINGLPKCPQTQIQTRIQTQIHIQTQISKLNPKPHGKVLTVNLGQQKPETMLEWYQGFISAKKICF